MHNRELYTGSRGFTIFAALTLCATAQTRAELGGREEWWEVSSDITSSTWLFSPKLSKTTLLDPSQAFGYSGVVGTGVICRAACRGLRLLSHMVSLCGYSCGEQWNCKGRQWTHSRQSVCTARCGLCVDSVGGTFSIGASCITLTVHPIYPKKRGCVFLFHDDTRALGSRMGLCE
ncbi:hypothetical protein BDV23DRAFT_99373 [Aspergillus alliaceus]|uniref:Uncharacterized protein n=1 Tax=Petromyces alliaceus TaxID=209559 RepID=A0A5N7C5H7_PETAA|nr:hypothetical protein BDV23DRAFT_99373 [Aspergillus alliaceus]